MPEQRGGATDDGGGHRVVSLCCCGVLGGDVGSGKRRGKCIFLKEPEFHTEWGRRCPGILPPTASPPPRIHKD